MVSEKELSFKYRSNNWLHVPIDEGRDPVSLLCERVIRSISVEVNNDEGTLPRSRLVLIARTDNRGSVASGRVPVRALLFKYRNLSLESENKADGIDLLKEHSVTSNKERLDRLAIDVGNAPVNAL